MIEVRAWNKSYKFIEIVKPSESGKSGENTVILQVPLDQVDSLIMALEEARDFATEERSSYQVFEV